MINRDKLFEELEDVGMEYYNNIIRGNKSYTLKSFINYFYKSTPFVEFIFNLKNNIGKSVFGNKLFNVILRRQDFYYNNSETNPPKESCVDYLSRRLFSDIPFPYHFDFSTKRITIDSFDQFIIEIKLTFGYSNRMRSSRLSKSSVRRKDSKMSRTSYCSLRNLNKVSFGAQGIKMVTSSPHPSILSYF